MSFAKSFNGILAEKAAYMSRFNSWRVKFGGKIYCIFPAHTILNRREGVWQVRHVAKHLQNRIMIPKEYVKTNGIEQHSYDLAFVEENSWEQQHALHLRGEIGLPLPASACYRIQVDSGVSYLYTDLIVNKNPVSSNLVDMGDVGFRGFSGAAVVNAQGFIAMALRRVPAETWRAKSSKLSMPHECKTARRASGPDIPDMPPWANVMMQEIKALSTKVDTLSTKVDTLSTKVDTILSQDYMERIAAACYEVSCVRRCIGMSSKRIRFLLGAGDALAVREVLGKKAPPQAHGDADDDDDDDHVYWA